MTAADTGNSARFTARPVSHGGTPTPLWMGWGRRFPSLDLTACPGMVVLAAHPDDETLGLGGTISALTAAGVRVDLVSASDGGAAHPGWPHRKRKCLERTRRLELRKAAKVLGVSETICLGLPDGEIGAYEAWLGNAITAILRRRPGVWCAATWRGDGHPDHEALGRGAVRRTARRRRAARIPDLDVALGAARRHRGAMAARPRRAADKLRHRPIKKHAAQSFRSQFGAPDDYGAPVLPAFVMRRLLAVGEVVFV